jgi:enamine deaminase RidA (YjgF/YER057c/UK114 family)
MLEPPTPEDRLVALGIELGAPPNRIGNYVGARLSGNVLYLAGHGPQQPDGRYLVGRVGSDLDLEAGRAAARLVGINLLATIRHVLGTLDAVAAVLKVTGMVNVSPGFLETPAVVDGCSDLLVDVFGEDGRHARTVMGVAELPLGIPVEIEMVVEVSAATE